MSPESVSSKRDLALLAADGAAITAGTFAVMMGAAFGLDALGVAPLSEPGGSGLKAVLSLLSWLLQVGGYFVGPLLAWWLHQRKFDRAGLVGLLVGFPVGSALAVPVAMLGAVFAWIGSKLTPSEFGGGIAYAALMLLVFLAAVLWVLVDAFRDLPAARREHLALDIARIVSALAVATFAAIVVALLVAGQDAAEAFVFVLIGAVEGAAVVTGAEIVVRLIRSRAAAQVNEGSEANPEAEAEAGT